jgi:hypothetical protein
MFVETGCLSFCSSRSLHWTLGRVPHLQKCHVSDQSPKDKSLLLHDDISPCVTAGRMYIRYELLQVSFLAFRVQHSAKVERDHLTIKMHKIFYTQDASKESSEFITSRWILSHLSRPLCIFIAAPVTYFCAWRDCLATTKLTARKI